MELDLAPPTPADTRDPDVPGTDTRTADLRPDTGVGPEPLSATDTGTAAIDTALSAPPPGVSQTVMDEARVAREAMLVQAGQETEIVVTAPRIDAEAVLAATTEIRERLDSGFLNPVTNGDLGVVQSTLRGLPKHDATAVVGSLSEAELGVWTTEAQRDLDAGQRASLYTTLAARLDGEQLARFSAAMTGGRDGGDGADFGRALARTAPPDVRLDFIDQADALIGRDADATLAVGEALGSLRGGDLTTALQGLDTAELRAIIRGGVAETAEMTSILATSLTYTSDAGTARRVLDALATTTDTTRQAIAVDAASDTIAALSADTPIRDALTETIRFEDAAIRELQTASLGLLRTDPLGIVGEMERSVDRNGQGLTDLAKSLIESGRSDDLGRLLTSIGTDRGRRPAADVLADQTAIGDDGRPYFANAQTLGYAVGAVHSAIESISDDRAARADMLKNVFGAAGGVAGAAGPQAGIAAAVLTGLGNGIVDDVVGRYRSGDLDLREALTALAYPHNANGTPFNGSAEVPFDATVGRVIDNRRN